MAFDLSAIQTGRALAPPRLVVYGPHGIGKTTLAASAPLPIGLFTEDGQGLLDVPRFPQAESYPNVIEALDSLITGEHEYQSVFIDSLDHLEPLMWQHVCEVNGKSSVEDFGYGRGYVLALDYWREFLSRCSALRARGMAVILIAHSEVKRYESPDTDPYDRHQIKLHRSASALVQEWSDCVFFANWKVSVTKSDAGFNREHRRGVTTGERLLHTVERPAYLAKNRYSLPEVLPLSWSAFSDALQKQLT